MNHTFFSVCSQYLNATAISFDWFDLGSCGDQDAYLMPLFLNPGTYLSVDGRNGEYPQSILHLKDNGFVCTDNFVKLDSFIGDKDGWDYLYETSEGTGSTFFPSRDLDTALLKPTECISYKRQPVKVFSLSGFLKQHNLSPFFGKIDLEGSEKSVLSDLFAHNLAPLIIEVEVNIGCLSESMQGMDTHTILSNNGYRLIDLRKTYDFPEISDESSISHLLSNASPTSVAFQGLLHQFDGLYVHTSLFETNDSALLLRAIYCLSLYRQFHLATRLAESGIIDLRLKDVCLSFLERSFIEFTATMSNNPATYHGFHPWFNWLKCH